MKIKRYIDSLRISLDTLMLSHDSREVDVDIAGYTAKKYLVKIKSSSCSKIIIIIITLFIVDSFQMYKLKCEKLQ